MKIQKSLIFLGVFFSLVCGFENKNSAWGEENQNGAEIPSNQEYLKTVCLFATLPLEKVVTSEIQKNGEIYLISSPEVGLYFIERNINILEQLQAQEIGLISQKAWKWDLAINYGWYGKLLRKVGKPEEAQSYFVKALKVSQDAGGKFTSQEELLDFLKRLEKSHLKSSQSKISQIDSTFPLIDKQTVDTK